MINGIYYCFTSYEYDRGISQNVKSYYLGYEHQYSYFSGLTKVDTICTEGFEGKHRYRYLNKKDGNRNSCLESSGHPTSGKIHPPLLVVLELIMVSRQTLLKDILLGIFSH
ncbi:hypothetical protein M9H77_12203 [Catharanthus roseus]|uniref:Uncharacterized protein n=1 Tax=Catharanthus roseus TaxID=4058 RepID=A0ACC0BGN5_CATRO|nr:hypothetical protein M9H77_12203 [Catharanthus roseus]